MLRVNTRRLTIKEVFDFDGIPLPGLTKLELDEADLVKTVPPLESAPDLVVYESKASFLARRSPQKPDLDISRTHM
jgi:hypothetical protein